MEIFGGPIVQYPVKQKRLPRYELEESNSNYADEYGATCGKLGLSKPNSKIARELSSELPALLTAKEICFRGNYLGERGMMALLPLLCRNHSFQLLDLAGNGLRSEAVSALVEVLLLEPHRSQRRRPFTVDLSDNPIASLGFDSLHNLVSKNPRVVQVDLSKTPVRGSLRVKLEKRLEANRRVLRDEVVASSLRLAEETAKTPQEGFAEVAAGGLGPLGAQTNVPASEQAGGTQVVQQGVIPSPQGSGGVSGAGLGEASGGVAAPPPAMLQQQGMATMIAQGEAAGGGGPSGGAVDATGRPAGPPDAGAGGAEGGAGQVVAQSASIDTAGAGSSSSPSTTAAVAPGETASTDPSGGGGGGAQPGDFGAGGAAQPAAGPPQPQLGAAAHQPGPPPALAEMDAAAGGGTGLVGEAEQDAAAGGGGLLGGSATEPAVPASAPAPAAPIPPGPSAAPDGAAGGVDGTAGETPGGGAEGAGAGAIGASSDAAAGEGATNLAPTASDAAAGGGS